MAGKFRKFAKAITFTPKVENENGLFLKVSSDYEETFTKDRFSFRALVKKLWPLQTFEIFPPNAVLIRGLSVYIKMCNAIENALKTDADRQRNVSK